MGNTHQDTSWPENMERGASGNICVTETLYFEFEFELNVSFLKKCVSVLA